MAIYIYETTDPKKPVRRFELPQSMKDAPYTQHPETGEPIRRVITGGFGYMGTGNPPKHADMKRERGSKGGSCGSGCGCHP
jgi:predicted nucleic acid-binding Zn ribbon protein